MSGGLLQGLSRGIDSATTGFARGLSLYDEMSQMADRQQERGKRKAADSEAQQFIQAGSTKGDPYKTADELSQIYLRHGLMDTYDSLQSKAMQFKAVKADSLAHQAFMVGSTNPIAAVDTMNQWSDLSGTGMKFGMQQTPNGGYRFSTTLNGKTDSKEFATKEEAHMAIGDMLERFTLKPEDYSTLAVNKGKAAEDLRHNRATEDTASRTADANIIQSMASAGASSAAAGASRAAAGLSNEKAVTEQLGRQDTIASKRADVAQKEASAIKDLTPVSTDPGVTGPQYDKGLQANLTSSFQELGMPFGQAFGLSQSLSNMTPEQLGSITSEGGVWHMPDGTALPNTPALHNALNQLMTQAGAGAEE